MISTYNVRIATFSFQNMCFRTLTNSCSSAILLLLLAIIIVGYIRFIHKLCVQNKIFLELGYAPFNLGYKSTLHVYTKRTVSFMILHYSHQYYVQYQNVFTVWKKNLEKSLHYIFLRGEDEKCSTNFIVVAREICAKIISLKLLLSFWRHFCFFLFF